MYCSGIDQLCADFGRAKNVPEEVTASMLKKMAEKAATAIKQTGEAMGVRDEESDVHILDNLEIEAPIITKSGGKISIRFKGTRKNGQGRRRNAEIAFINEFGKDSQLPRPFMKTALKKYENDIVNAGYEVFDNWLFKT